MQAPQTSTTSLTRLAGIAGLFLLLLSHGCSIDRARAQDQEPGPAMDREARIDALNERREAAREAWMAALAEDDPELAAELEAWHAERQAMRERFPEDYPRLHALVEERREHMAARRVEGRRGPGMGLRGREGQRMMRNFRQWHEQQHSMETDE